MHRYFIRNFLVYLLVIVLPLLLLGLSVYFYSSSEIQRDVNLRAENKYKLGMQYLESILNVFPGNGSLFNNSSAMSSTINKINNSQSLDYTDSNIAKIITAILSNYANTSGEIDSIYVYTKNDYGNFIRSEYGLSSITKQSDSQWYDVYQATDSQEASWLSVYKGKYYDFESPRTIISLFYRMTRVNGVIVVNLNARKMASFLDTLVTEEEEMIFFTDEQNSYIFGNTLANSTLQYGMQINALSDIHPIGSAGNMYTVNFSGNQYIMTQAVSSQLGIHYYSMITSKVLYSLPYHILIFTLIAMAFGLVVSVIISLILTQKNVRQINYIVATIEDAQKGIFHHEKPSKWMNVFDDTVNNVIHVFLHNNYLELRINQLQLEKELAEFRSLQLQINPHFLFNTLQSIDMHVRQMQPALTSFNMIADLSEILRYSLEVSGDLVMLREEIDICKKYLNIQMVRYPNRFAVIWEFDEDVLDLPIIRLLLQPILENSISHGILPSGKKGIVKIRFEHIRNRLYVSIIDNGIGIPKDRLAVLRDMIYGKTIPQGAQNIGLANTNQRLFLRYDENSKLRLFSMEGRGTIISFSIPCKDSNPVAPLTNAENSLESNQV